MVKFGFLGTDGTAAAVINGLLAISSVAPADLLVYKTADVALNGVATTDDPAQVLACRFVFVAACPPEARALLKESAASASFRSVFVILTEGLKIATLKRYLGKEVKAVRVVTNRGAAARKAVSALAYEMPITYQELEDAKALFEALGTLRVVEEAKLADWESLTDASFVYFAQVAEKIAELAAESGFDADLTATLAEELLQGVAASETTLAQLATENTAAKQSADAFRRSGLTAGLTDAVRSTASFVRDREAFADFNAEGNMAEK